MRLAPTLLLSSLASLCFPSIFALTPHASRTIAQRQHRVPRALLDVCIYLDLDVMLGVGILPEILDILGDIEICLCLSALPLFLETNIKAKILVDLLGKSEVTALLTALINDAPGSKHCTYPPNSHSICAPENPCAFECDKPYVKVGNTCVCQSPNTLCNGQCGPPQKSCSSAVSRSPRQTRSTITTYAQAQATCVKQGKHACGIFGNSGFECASVDTDFENCGGCTTAAPFPGAPPPSGKDCSKISNALEASCKGTRCQVQRCKHTYEVSPNGDECVPSGTKVTAGAVTDNTGDPLRMRKRKRSLYDVSPLDAAKGSDIALFKHRPDVLDTNAIAIADIDLPSYPHSKRHDNLNDELLTNTYLCVGAIIKLNSNRGSLPSSNPTTTLLSLKLDVIVNSTIALLTAPTTANLITSISAVVDADAQLKAALANCNATDLGLGALVVDLDAVIALVAKLQDWCNGVPDSSSSSPSPVYVGLENALANLGLGGVGVAAVVAGLGSGSGPIDAILAGLHLGGQPDAHGTASGPSSTIPGVPSIPGIPSGPGIPSIPSIPGVPSLPGGTLSSIPGLSGSGDPTVGSSPSPSSPGPDSNLVVDIKAVIDVIVALVSGGNGLSSSCNCTPSSSTDPNATSLAGLIASINAVVRLTLGLGNATSYDDLLKSVQDISSAIGTLQNTCSSTSGLLTGDNDVFAKAVAGLSVNVGAAVDAIAKVLAGLDGCGKCSEGDLLQGVLSGIKSNLAGYSATLVELVL